MQESFDSKAKVDQLMNLSQSTLSFGIITCESSGIVALTAIGSRVINHKAKVD